MAKTKRYFLSDIHLGTGRSCDWYQKAKHERFLVSALSMIADTPETKDLVLLGDIFDTWMSPLETPPPTVSQIIKEGGHEKALDALARCSDNVENIFYVNGNHDMQTTQYDLDLLQLHAGLRKRIQRIPVYQAGRLYAEHGSRFTMFNAPDRMHDPKDGLPLGYYVTRLLAGSQSYLKPSALKGYVDDLLEASFTTQTLASSVIEALMEETQRKPSDAVQMPAPRRPILLSEVKERYATLFDRWVEKYGHWYALNAVRGEMNSLGWFADRMCRKKGYKVIVLGHTHEACEDVDGWLEPDRVYANTGYFCCSQPTFVEVDKLPKEFNVRIWRADGDDGRFKVQQEANVSG